MSELMLQNTETKRRYFALDGIRGLALVNMIVYHAIWDLVYLFGFDWQWFEADLVHIWQQAGCWIFIFLSGFCQAMGRKTPKRGLLVFSLGLIISVITVTLMPENQILFGILTLLGSCMLITLPLESILKKCSPLLGCFMSIFSFIFIKNINNGYLGFENWLFLKLPDAWYSNLATAYLGLPAPDFYSTDYFPLFPWYCLFLAGYFWQQFMQVKEAMEYLGPSRMPRLEWVGRHSLEIYIAHQPVLYLLLSLLFAGRSV